MENNSIHQPNPTAPSEPPQSMPPAPVQPAPAPVPPTAEKSGLSGVLSGIGLLVLAPLFAWVLVLFVFQSYIVDGPSMQTTLMNHDRLIVYKLPRSVARITHHPYIPHRGDIIIFDHPDNVDLGTSEKHLIKRVIALPGERVVVRNGQLTVYNQEHPDGFSPDRTMAYGSVIGVTNGDIDLTVPVNEVFVCGDNRPNSLDSRFFGTVPVNKIVGRLGLRIFPLNKAQSF